MDGIAATAKIREESNVPIILLTAKSETSDKILGLNIGADDYITKPFDPMEVLARVRSQLRRYTALGSRSESQDVITIGSVTLDDPAKTVTVDGEAVSLTPSEYGILRLLMRTPARSFPLAKIYEAVWNETGAGPRAPWPSTSGICGKKSRSTPPSPGTSRWSGARVQIRPHGPGRIGGRHATPLQRPALEAAGHRGDGGQPDPSASWAATPPPGAWPRATIPRTRRIRPLPAATIRPRAGPRPWSPAS